MSDHEAVGRPQALERVVGRVAEAVPVAEVVQPALPIVVVREPEADEPADAVRVPGHRLRQRQLVVLRRIAERRIEAIAHAEHQPSEHVRAPRAGQVARTLGIFERAALDGDDQRIDRRDRGATQRRGLVDLEANVELGWQSDRGDEARR